MTMNTLRWTLLIATEEIFWTGLVAFFALHYGSKPVPINHRRDCCLRGGLGSEGHP